MADLAQLFTDVQELVIQQEPAVTQIQQGAEETHRNVQQANTKLESAIISARNARRWKWYALIIVRKLLSSALLSCVERCANSGFSSHHHWYRRWCRSRCYRGQQGGIQTLRSDCFAFPPTSFPLPPSPPTAMYDPTIPPSPRTRMVATRIPPAPHRSHPCHPPSSTQFDPSFLYHLLACHFSLSLCLSCVKASALDRPYFPCVLQLLQVSCTAAACATVP